MSQKICNFAAIKNLNSKHIMSNNQYDKAKLRLFAYTLLFIAILSFGYITVWVAMNMAQTPLILTIIGASGPVWAIISVWYIASQNNYWKYWKMVFRNRAKQNQQLDAEFFPEYQELKEKYPLAVRRHEQHCRHHGIDVDKMVEQAMNVSEEEWAKREEFRRASHEERHRDDNKQTYEPRRDSKHRHI